jgi:hypothetical protein
MWLPHYISVFLWASHLTLYANATYKLWFPYQVEGYLPSSTSGVYVLFFLPRTTINLPLLGLLQYIPLPFPRHRS